MATDLKRKYAITVLSGDNESEKQNLLELFGESVSIHFNQKPEDKLAYVRRLGTEGKKVMMIGDGLNDAGALNESSIGISVSAQANNFTPASDAIIDAARLSFLPEFIRLCKANKKVVVASFILSILYNTIGLFFAVQGQLSPLLAAILMPSSSLSILLVTFGASSWFARYLKL